MICICKTFCVLHSCWAHIRRYLIDAIPKGKEYDHSQPAVQGLACVDKLFDMERKIHEKKGSDFDAIKKFRLEKEKPVLYGFWNWLDCQTAIKNSRMYKALVYIQHRRPFLETYLEDGGCSFNNNTSERSVRPFTIGRKNFVMINTIKGAKASAIIYAIVQTAKLNNLSTYYYLDHLLTELPKLCAKSKKEI